MTDKLLSGNYIIFGLEERYSMRILLTGGCGFIGSAVIRHIIHDTPHSVLNVDCMTYAASPETVEDAPQSERYTFSQTNITDTAALEKLFSSFKPDAVMHLAAESHVDRSIDGPGVFIQTNVVGTYSMLEAARKYWMGLDEEAQKAFRFHHISTDEVFGALGPKDPRLPKPLRMTRVAHILPARRLPIIWCGRGIIHSGCRLLSPTRQTTTASGISLKS